MEYPLVVTVILNTNRRDDTLAALDSLEKASYPNHQVIVLDNASTDGSVEAVCSQFPRVRIIRLDRNLGYAGNNNVGIQAALEADADWIFVLNEDTIVDPDCLAELVEVGENNPKIGIAGPMVFHYDEPGVIQSAGGLLNARYLPIHVGQNQEDTGQFPEPRSVDWITGCSIFVRRAVLLEIGGLDERFFYYWEETEWCVRARRRGWQIVLAPKAKIWHKGVQRNYRPSPNVTYYATRNRLLLMSKHHAPLSAWTAVVFELFFILVNWTIRPKYRAMGEHRKALWQGAMDFIHQRWGIRS
jgi:GT2 family glycosyltransferase